MSDSEEVPKLFLNSRTKDSNLVEDVEGVFI